jgi:hypothetical protein
MRAVPQITTITPLVGTTNGQYSLTLRYHSPSSIRIYNCKLIGFGIVFRVMIYLCVSIFDMQWCVFWKCHRHGNSGWGQLPCHLMVFYVGDLHSSRGNGCQQGCDCENCHFGCACFERHQVFICRTRHYIIEPLDWSYSIKYLSQSILLCQSFRFKSSLCLN